MTVTSFEAVRPCHEDVEIIFVEWETPRTPATNGDVRGVADPPNHQSRPSPASPARY